MKWKLRTLIFCAVGCIQPLQAYKYSVDFRMANAQINWERFNHIFPASKIESSIEFGAVLPKLVRTELWISAGRMRKYGKTTGLEEGIQVTSYPFGIGVKHFVPITKNLEVYLGGGALATHLKITCENIDVDSPIHHWGAGAVLKTGFRLNISRGFYLGGFADLTQHKVRVRATEDQPGKPIRLSGWRLGFDIGIKF